MINNNWIIKKDLKEYLFESIEEKFGTAKYNAVSSFACGNESMDRFLHQSAYMNSLEFNAHTKLVLNEKGVIVAYVTTLMDTIEVNHEKFLCLNMARIGVNLDYQEKGIGSMVIEFVKELTKTVSVRYIVLDALFEKKKWYEDRGFIALKDEAGPFVYMYCDMLDEGLVTSLYDNP
jgi:predicted N-acetyltransferase YhbS